MTDSSSNTQTNEIAKISFFIEKIWPLSGIVAAVSIIFSFIHDWGFYYELGISFAHAPTSLSDHVQSWLVWLPSVIVATIILLVFEMLGRRIKLSKNKDEVVNSSVNPSKIKKFINSPWNLIGITGIVSISIWLIFGNSAANSFYIGLMVCWMLFSVWVFGNPKSSAQHSVVLKGCILLAPLTIFAIFFFGQVSARELSTHPSLYRAGIELSNESQYINIALIRSFDEWLLIRNDSNNVAWLRIDRIYSLELLEQRKTFPGLLCVLNERFCLPNV